MRLTSRQLPKTSDEGKHGNEVRPDNTPDFTGDSSSYLWNKYLGGSHVRSKTMYISEVKCGMNTQICTIKDPERKPAKKLVGVQLETYAESEANHSKKQDDVCFEKLDKKELDRKGLLEQDEKRLMKDIEVSVSGGEKELKGTGG